VVIVGDPNTLNAMKSNPFEAYQNRLADIKASQQEPKTPPAPKLSKPPAPPPANPQNPYLRARNDVLARYTKDHRAEILAYERDNDTDNRFYLEFCHDVAVLGDQYMPI
jgi:hypothetical protein